MKKRLVRGTAVAVFCIAFVMVLAGCGGTGSPANGPGFDERLFGTWKNEFMWGQEVAINEMKLRNDWTYVIVVYAENHGKLVEIQARLPPTPIFLFVTQEERGYMLGFHYQMPIRSLQLTSMVFRMTQTAIPLFTISLMPPN